MMGLSPAEVRRCSLSAFHAAFEGFAQFNGAKPDGAVSEDEFLAVLAEEIEAGRA